jgi:hypothetical protein
MSPEEGFEAVKPLTQLGIALGKIKEEIDIPEDIPWLGIKKGRYNLQRFFYYHIMKLFYNPSLPFQRHVVNNWNAYYPKHVLFLPAEQIRSFLMTSASSLGYGTSKAMESPSSPSSSDMVNGSQQRSRLEQARGGHQCRSPSREGGSEIPRRCQSRSDLHGTARPASMS